MRIRDWSSDVCSSDLAPKGDCAPSLVIDAHATKDLSATGPVQDSLRPPVSVASGDQTRTSERTLRIVFPAHLDETGTLHDDAVAGAETGRASCRESVCQVGAIWGVGVSVKKKE